MARSSCILLCCLAAAGVFALVVAGCGAIVSLLLSLSDDLRLRGMLFWLLGDFSYVQTPGGCSARARAIPACLLARVRSISTPRDTRTPAIARLCGFNSASICAPRL
ncbi:MAG: hypothetical protein HC828_14500 [Blastochloris sp.]|nr:hypothetical protein [Blastochloris sp.]